MHKFRKRDTPIRQAMFDSSPAQRLPQRGKGLPRAWTGRLATLVLVALTFAGCGKSGGGSAAANDPELDARLTQLTKELRHTMVGRTISRDFDEFVTLRKLEVPPPPPGKKYAISEKWKVIVVDK